MSDKARASIVDAPKNALPIATASTLSEAAGAGLVAPGVEIFDADQVASDLRAVQGEPLDFGPKRLAAAAILKEAQQRGRARIERAFFEDRRSGIGVARALSWLTDRIVESAFRFAQDALFPSLACSESDRLAVIAVGGYGRGEMAPFSDVDLLFLTPYKLSSRNESVIEATLYTLWDLRLKVGHATRGVEECLRAARGDMTIRTALLENRPICGDADLAIQLRDRLWEGLFSTTAEQFVTAKLLERDERHRRTGGSRYLLEPNVKESKGGLRDVQTLLWLAKYIYRAELWRDLIDKRVFTAEEVSRCRLAKAHLWTVRCGLHYLAGRAQEKLTFDYQVDLAERFGYRASGGQRPVERFMKRYFIAAKQVGDLTRIFCAALEHQHRKAPPLTGLRRYFMTTPPEIERTPWLEIRDGRVAVSDQAAFDADPINLLKIVEIGVSTNLFVHPDALRLMARRVREIDDDVRAREDVRALFVKLVSESADPVRALRRLSETGVLQRLIPEFQRVTGMMQFNMYHHFTVDEHLIQTVEQHQLLKTGALADRHPGESQLVESVSEQRVLAVAALLHDIGKGLREDHSTAGARLAAGICADLGMSEAETHTISWLVLHHLAMSDMAQKRDISDPRTVRAFADLVRSPVRLKLLYALTICDIRAVGPGVWNSWKAQLLRQLYNDARAMLIGEDPALTRHERAEAAQAAAHERAAEWSEEAWAAHVARLPASYWIGLDAETHIAHARMMADPQPAADSLRMDVRQEPGRDATEVSFYTADHPGLFARITGALALAGASVVECRATTTRDGMAINSFWVQEPADDDTSAPSAYDDPDRLSRLRDAVKLSLAGQLAPREALKARRKLKPRERKFEVAPSVVIDNAASDILTVVEVNGRDRVGLLHDLARALAAENVNIVSAIVATYGEHAVDVFYVKDVFGMKIVTESKHRRLEAALLTAIENSAPA